MAITEICTDECMTVGDLKKALKKLPDSTHIGTAMSGLNGFLNKAVRVFYNKDLNIVIIDEAEESMSFEEVNINNGAEFAILFSNYENDADDPDEDI